MTVEIKVPDLGTTVEEVTLKRWLKNEGDFVKRGEPLCEIETDKATTDLESFAQGTLLRRRVAEETKVTVGTVIAYLGEPGETVPEAKV
jgi:pyruvate/2-oxoglutarate dehydrogenase complex dihydrolipoamide acyltransferase (E2) component